MVEQTDVDQKMGKPQAKLRQVSVEQEVVASSTSPEQSAAGQVLGDVSIGVDGAEFGKELLGQLSAWDRLRQMIRQAFSRNQEHDSSQHDEEVRPDRETVSFWPFIDPKSELFDPELFEKYSMMMKVKPRTYRTLSSALSLRQMLALRKIFSTDTGSIAQSYFNDGKSRFHISRIMHVQGAAEIVTKRGTQWLVRKTIGEQQAVIVFQDISLLEQQQSGDDKFGFHSKCLEIKRLLIKLPSGRWTDVASLIPTDCRFFFRQFYSDTQKQGDIPKSVGLFWHNSEKGEVVIDMLETEANLASALHEIGHAQDPDISEQSNSRYFAAKHFEKFLRTGDQMQLCSYMGLVNKLDFDDETFNEAYNSLSAKERLASAWASAVLEGHVGVGGEELQRMNLHFQKCLATYDSLLSARGAASNELSSVPLEIRQKVSKYMMWMVKMYDQYLGNIDIPYLSRKIVNFPIMDGEYNVSLLSNQEGFSLEVFNAGTSKLEAFLAVGFNSAQFYGSAVGINAQGFQIKFINGAKLTEQRDLIMSPDFEAFMGAAQELLAAVELQIQEQSQSAVDRIKTIISPLKYADASDPASKDGEYVFKPDGHYTKHGWLEPTQLEMKKYQRQKHEAYHRLNGMLHHLSLDISEIIEDGLDMLNSDTNKYTGEKIVTEADRLLLILDAYLEQDQTGSEPQKTVYQQLAEYLRHEFRKPDDVVVNNLKSNQAN